MIWTDNSTPFPFDKGGSGVLSVYSLCGTVTTLSFSVGPVWSSFSAEASAILQALCWSQQQQSSLPRLSLCLCHIFLSFYLNLSGRSGRNCLLFLFVLLGYNESPGIHITWGTTLLIIWQDGERYSCPEQSLVLSLFLSLVCNLLFSRTGVYGFV